ncbi:MAG: phosphoribosylamine--glycine ligase, partial [Saprospiraceae bacterium]|nr:phosphoribosylamine--glycine ligase [Saprospiraceae bacterium]
IQPTIKGIQQRGLDYKGFIFFGLIVVEGKPYVIEYNCRMGDPETQVVFPRWNNDIMEALVALSEGRLSEIEMDIDPQSAATVILVAGGYPNQYEKGKVIEGIAKVEGSLVFHAGTLELGDQIVTNGGRVIAITSLSNTFQAAVQQSIVNAAHIDFEGKYFRRDIGFDL